MPQENGKGLAAVANVPEEVTGQPRRVVLIRLSWRHTFASLRHRNFRLFFGGQLISLIGTWMQNTAQGWLVYELTGANTTLVERETAESMPGMMTMFHLNSGKLMLTHYCMAGNQPTMKGSYTPETKTITFDFVSASNLKSVDDGHMHHAVYTFIDNDHFKTTWTFRKEQKDAFTEDVTYVRTK